MSKRFFLFSIFLVLLMPNFAFSECFFGEFDSSCERFSSVFNDFILNIDSESDFEKIDAKIYLKNNINNVILTKIEENIVTNVVPFREPGVYVLDVKIHNLDKSVVNKKFEFVFDNTKPLPPLVDLNLESDGNQISINGFAEPNSQVLVKNLDDSSTTTFDVDNFGDFLAQIQLNNELNFFEFTVSKSTLESEPIGRVIFNTEKIEDFISISNLVFDDFSLKNSETVFDGINYFTTKRDFLVSGNVASSEIGYFYLNGIKTYTDSSGNFANYVLLNEGENIIEVVHRSGELISSKIFFIQNRFKFVDLDYEKVLPDSNFQILGNVNQDLPFEIYLNGENVALINPVDGSFTFSTSELLNGKNFLTLNSYSGEVYNDIIYVDSEEPQIDVLTGEKIANLKEFVFKFSDDIAISYDSINVLVDGNNFDISNFEIKGDYFILSIPSLNEGNHNIEVSVDDISGKSSSISFNSQVLESNILIDRIVFPKGGSLIGDSIFVKRGLNKLIIAPSRYVALEKLFLDSKEVVDYEIKSNGNIEVNFDFVETSGEIEFLMVGNDYTASTVIYSYFTDDEKPIVELDYLENLYGTSGKIVKISGKIIDSNFNFNSLEINSQNTFLRFGENFEAYVSLENLNSGNLNFVGEDFSGNFIENDVFGGMILLDNTDSSLSLDSYSKNGFSGSLNNFNDNINNYLLSYNGISSNGVNLKSQFTLPISDFYGVRSLNLRGIESSDREFKSIESVTIDPIVPKIFFIETSTTLDIIVDGTLSPINSETLDILVDNVSPLVVNTCSSFEKKSLFENCFRIQVNEGDIVSVQVSDLSGNDISKSHIVGSGSDIRNQFDDVSLKIYFSGNDLFADDNDYFIQGQYISSNLIKSIKVGNVNCKFDEYNFYCPVSLGFGLNNLNVEIIDVDSNQIIKEIDIQFLQNNLDVNLNSIGPESLVFNVDGDYFTLSKNLFGDVEISNETYVSLFLDNREVKIGKFQNGNFQIPIDINLNVENKENEIVEAKFVVEDNFGNEASSNVVKIIFNRIAETIVDIIIN